MKTQEVIYDEGPVTHNFEGQGFVADGSFVTEDRVSGVYPRQEGTLADGQGKIIGKVMVLSRRRAVFFGRRSWIGSYFYYMRAEIQGRQYSLRGFGSGMVAQGKRYRGRVMPIRFVPGSLDD